MRILVLHSLLGVLRGGGENFTRNLFAAFAARGHSVAAAFAADRRCQYPIELPPSLNPIPIPGWWSPNLGQAPLSIVGCRIPPMSQLKIHWDHFQEAIGWRTFRWHNRRFIRRMEQELPHLLPDCDAVYVHGDALLAGHVAQYRPTVLRLPGPVTADLEPVLRRIHAVCANGDALTRIREFLGDHAVELPVGLDDRLFRPGPTSVRAALGWSDQDRVIGYVGRLSHIKGVDLLAAAFRQVVRTVPEAKLLIIGRGEEGKGIRLLLAKEYARGAVHIEPDVDHAHLAEWYRAMDCLVMPSRYENFSNTLLEGMACGVPFVASDIGGNRMLAEAGAGWLFPPASLGSLAAYLGEVATSRAETRARGDKASDYVSGRYSWSRTARHLEDIIASYVRVA